VQRNVALRVCGDGGDGGGGTAMMTCHLYLSLRTGANLPSNL